MRSRNNLRTKYSYEKFLQSSLLRMPLFSDGRKRQNRPFSFEWNALIWRGDYSTSQVTLPSNILSSWGCLTTDEGWLLIFFLTVENKKDWQTSNRQWYSCKQYRTLFRKIMFLLDSLLGSFTCAQSQQLLIPVPSFSRPRSSQAWGLQCLLKCPAHGSWWYSPQP